MTQYPAGTVAKINFNVEGYRKQDVLALKSQHGVWYHTEGRLELEDSEVTNVRPVVILEVDDTLRDFARVWHSGTGFSVNRIAKSIAEQLPPEKPAIKEPQGYGAIVRLASGGLATRTGSNACLWRDEKGMYYKWSELDVAKVLFKGVTS